MPPRCISQQRVGAFEQAATAGGAIKTGEYTLSGYRQDWAAMNLSLFAVRPFFTAYAGELARHRCKLVPVDRPFCSSFPDGARAGVSTVGDETLASFRTLAPEDSQTFQDLTGRFGAEAPHLSGLLGSETIICAFACFIFQLFRAKGLAGALDMGRFLLSTPRAWLEEAFRHPHIRTLRGARGMHLDLVPDVAGGAMFPCRPSRNRSTGWSSPTT
ncbi:MAG: hypothetical protein ACK4FR_07480 [Tabrizicola sp.]